MTAMLPCEYCGQMTPWNLRLCVPACCAKCGHMPLILGSVWLAISAILLVFAIMAWRAFA